MRALLAVMLIAALVVAGFVAVELAGPDGSERRRGDDGPEPPRGDVPDAPPQGRGQSWWEPQLVRALGDPKTSGLAAWPRDFDAAPIKAYDFDGDGTKELVAHGNDTQVYVFDSKSGRVLATFKTSYPPAWHIERILNGVEAARLAPNAPPSIIVANHAAFVGVWEFVPADSTDTKFAFVKKWERRLNDFHPSPGMDSKPVIADLDGDGDGEILAQTEEVGLFALHHTGEVLWAKEWGGGNAAPNAGDLDGDGDLEAVFAGDNGFIQVFDGKTGRPVWNFDAKKAGDLGPASIPTQPALGDLDGDGKLEVVVAARDAHARTPDVYAQNHMAVLAVKGNLRTGQGELLWLRQPSWANPLSYAHLIVHDVTGDGRPEVLGMDWNTMGHRPGEWERLGPAHVFALRPNGDDLWVREVDAWWSNKDLVLADFDGNGKLEVLANGPRDGYDGFWRFDAATGQPTAFLAVWPWKVQRAPIAVDLWNTGTMQLVLPVEPIEALDAAPGAEGALLVYDTKVPLNAPWPGTEPPPRTR